MTRPLLSVLMPYRDCEATLDEALAGVLGEEEPALEVVAIDDGSEDSSAALVTRWAQRDPRVVMVQGRGAGIADALGRGLARCSAPFLARMDADDVSLPGRFAASLARLREDPGLAVVATRVEAFPDVAVGEGLRRWVAWQNGLTTPADHHREIFIDAPLVNPSATFRRDAFEAVGGYLDDGFAEDYSLWLRLDEAGYRFAKLERCYLRWRQREGRATFTQPHFSREAMRGLKAGFLARRILSDGRPLSVWGAGRDGRRTARALEEHGLRPRRFVDIDPRKIGRLARGRPIEPPSTLTHGDFVLVSVAVRGARDEIRAFLDAAGFTEGADYLCCA